MLSDDEKHQTAKLRRLIYRWTKRKGWAPELRERTLGLLSQLDNPRVKDRIKKLLAQRRVDPSHFQSWSALRNRRVHAVRYDPSKLSTGDLQNILLMIGETTVLMYHIIFELIGYEGVYTDYATLTYPTKQYPLS